MKAFVKVVDGIVVQKQPNPQEGFLEAPTSIVCGMPFMETQQEIEVWEAGQVVQEPTLTRLYKSTLIRRLGGSLSAQFEDILANENAYVRMLFHASEWFGVDDAMVTYMHMVFEAELGLEAANALLEPDH